MPAILELELEVGKKKDVEAAAPPPMPASPAAKAKDSQLTIRLKDKVLAYRLGMVLQDRGLSAWEFVEPLIRDDVEIAFAELQKKIQQMPVDKDAAPTTGKKKAE